MAGGLDLCSGVFMGGGGPRHNSKNYLKTAGGGPHRGQEPWGINSLRIESYMWCFPLSVLLCVCMHMGSSLCSLIRVVPVPISHVDKSPLDVGLMLGPHKVPRGKAHPIFTNVAHLQALALGRGPSVHETQ